MPDVLKKFKRTGYGQRTDLGRGVSFTFYDARTEDVILDIPLSPSTGFFRQAQNAAAFDLGRLAAAKPDAIQALVPWQMKRKIDAEAPTHFEAPSGSHVPIDYQAVNTAQVHLRLLKDGTEVVGNRFTARHVPLTMGANTISVTANALGALPAAALDTVAADARLLLVLDQVRDDVPVDLDVEVHAEPAAVADVGRAEVALRRLGDQRLLHVGARRAPEGHAVVVMLVREHHEGLLAADEPGRFAVAQAFGHLGQRQAEAAQVFECVHPDILRHVPAICRYRCGSR